MAFYISQCCALVADFVSLKKNLASWACSRDWSFCTWCTSWRVRRPSQRNMSHSKPSFSYVEICSYSHVDPVYRCHSCMSCRCSQLWASALSCVDPHGDNCAPASPAHRCHVPSTSQWRVWYLATWRPSVLHPVWRIPAGLCWPIGGFLVWLPWVVHSNLIVSVSPHCVTSRVQ